jgi:oxygen-independent coproporphyrinogen-3 oxidase
MATNGERQMGVYLHFPWCLSKCPYCDFVSFAREPGEIDHAGYAELVLRELELRAEAFSGRRLASVFVGGGTPSLWQPAQLGRVLRRVAELATPVAEGVETTVECNPSSLDEAHARALVDQGVERLSIGVQGFDAERLAFLGRWHTPSEGSAAVRAALRAGVPRVSADLIYGVAGGRRETAAEAANEAGQVADLGVGHVSAYALTIESNTGFGARAREGALPIARDATLAESFEAVGEALAARGFERYEVSNYARGAGERSRHNLGYWRGDDYLGLGCAAYGTLSSADGDAQRYRNPPTFERYRMMVEAGELRPHEQETLDGETLLRERIMLGLRLREGVDIEAAAAELGVPAWPARRRRALEEMVANGKVQRDGGRVWLRGAGWLFADGLAAELF